MRASGATANKRGDISWTLDTTGRFTSCRSTTAPSFEKGLFGFTAPLSVEQTETVAASKKVVYDGLKMALTRGVPREAAGILVDEQFGADILRDARSNGYITCRPAEKSGQNEFNFEYGDKLREHMAEFKPTFAKALVRYNPEGDEAMNRRQAARLKDSATMSIRTTRISCSSCWYR